MDMDSAFAWLESLAVKQGAEEGTLLVSPEEPRRPPPAWVQQEIVTEKEPEPIPQLPISEMEIPEEISPVSEPEAEAQMVQPVELEPVEQTTYTVEEATPHRLPNQF